MAKENGSAVDKLETGIPGLELVSCGGLPRRRTTLVCGTAGSAKTVFAAHFLAEGIRRGEPGVFITFEETPADIRRNMLGLGWNIQQWEEEGKWAFVDASPDPHHETLAIGHYDFGGLLARIEHAAQRVGAQRASLDSVAAVFSQFEDRGAVRRELRRVASALREMGLTAVLTAERNVEYGDIARHGVEEFVADNVIILRNVLEDETRRRTIEILKFRGTTHQKGEWPFTVVPGVGVVVIPLSAIELSQRSSNVRITSGNHDLDAICGGGFFRDSIVLVSGATGTGKTLTVSHFVAGGAAAGERCLFIAFEESRDQLFRNASGWGMDFEKLEADGKLRVVCEYPESSALEDHVIRIKDEIESFKPDRVAVDSLSALERVSTVKGFREAVIGLTSFIKQREIAGLFTATTPTLVGGTSVTETHVSTITDSIILLRYVEVYGEMRRGLAVLKMRGSAHEKDIREFMIDGKGMHIGKPFRNITGILTGNFSHIAESEIPRVESLFKEEAAPTE
jgi:circadian clock protein KaiC